MADSPQNPTNEEYPLLINKDRPRKRCCSCKACVGIVLGFAGILFVVVAASTHWIIDHVIHNQIASQLPLVDNKSTTYSPWLSPPTPIYMQFWFFNVKNPDEVVGNGAKPVLEQIGPLSYLEKRHKVNFTFHPDGLITYREITTFHFLPEMSAIEENTTFTSVNLPLVVVADKLRYQLKTLHRYIELFLKFLDKGLFVEKTVHDIVWGYEDPALKFLANLVKPFGVKIDPMVGLFYGKNNSDDGEYAIFNGANNLDDFMHIHSWNGNTSLGIWSSPYANQLNGTDGTMFAPFVTEDRDIFVFTSDLCRSLLLKYDSRDEVQGIPGYRFLPPASVLANVSTNPDNIGFCIPNCLGAGVLNMSRCVPGGVPVVMSQPHFYQGADEYIYAVEGLHPSSEDTTEIVLEPTTGVVIKAQKKIQINLALSNVTGFADLALLPESLFLPLLWVNESAVIDDKSANDLKSSVVLANKMSFTTIIVSSVLGLLLLLICAAWVMYHHGSPKPLLDNGSINHNEWGVM